MTAPRYHAFLSHNTADKPAVEVLAHRLRQAGLEPWLDRWNLIPGEPWQTALADALDACETCVVFIGPGGIGPWQHEEMSAAINRRVTDAARRFRVIPVLLPGGQREERSRLPEFLVAATWVEFRDTLDDEDAFHRLACGIRGIAPGPGPGATIGATECPYRGLQAFDAEHAPFFFGREALTDWLLNDLRPQGRGREANRFLAIVGASGSGKSSLARAGLLARLQAGALDPASRWPQIVCWPGPEPLESLGMALAAHPAIRPHVGSFNALIADLEQNPRTLHRLAGVVLHSAPASARLVVLVDQFEEVFTQCQQETTRRQLIDNLLHAATVANGRVIVVLTLRADFYGKCAGHAQLAAALSDHQVLVGPLTPTELRLAIERPALLVGGELEAGLVEMLVQDAQRQPGALPLLQHTLAELWERRVGRRLTFADYEAIGRIHGALERRANEVFERLDDTQREICQRIFLRLTQPGEETEDSKRRATLDELLPAGGSPEAVRAVLDALADARLVTIEPNRARPADPVVEVAHEALIRGWSRLRGWIEADREGLRTHRKLTADARDWELHGRHRSLLYYDIRLALVEDWLRTHPDALSPLERAFIEASRLYQEEMVRLRQDEALHLLSGSNEMLLARQVQQNMLPTTFPQVPGLEIGALAVPAAAVGGDLYDAFPMLDGQFAIVVGDVVGHGFAPALQMAHLRACLRTAAALQSDAETIVALADRIAFEGSRDERFATLSFVQIDPGSRTFRHISAGHEAYLLDAAGEAHRLEATTGPLGIDLGLPFSMSPPAPLEPGDTLILATDGITESLSPGRELFGWKRTVDVVRSLRHKPAAEIAHQLCLAARDFTAGAPQADDMTALIVKVLEN